MKFPVILATLFAVAAVAPAARADYAADFKLLKQFEPVLKNNDIATAKNLIVAPNFRPLMSYGEEFYTVFDDALGAQRLEIARLMMKSAGWKKTRWSAGNVGEPLNRAATYPMLFPLLRELARLPHFDINAHDTQSGNFPLSEAADADNMAAVKWLVAQPRISLSERDGIERTALFGAGPQALSYLLSLRKIDINARDTDGQTALHFAAYQHKANSVKMLLKARGINANIKDNYGQTPLGLAMKWEDNWSNEIIEILMADPKVKVSAAQRAKLKEAKAAQKAKEDEMKDLPNKTYAG